MKETYTLLLSSQNATNRIGTNKWNLQYYINWNAVLPNPQNINPKFLVRFILSSTVITSGFNDVYSLNIDFGGSNMYDQNGSKNNYLGLVYPSFVSTFDRYFYTMAKLNDNLPVTIEYPNNSLITVNFINILASSGTTCNYEYYLTLEFTPID